MQISWFLSTVTIVTAALLACNTSKPNTATSEPEPAQAPTPPAVETSDECQVMLVLAADKATLAGPVTLLARAKNLTAKPLELILADRCPGGEAHFAGLESQDESYDYYHTCMMGACAGGRPPIVIALPPGELVDISSTQIDPDGKSSCNGPIAAGTYKLSFSVSPPKGSSNPVMCGPEPLVLRRK